MKKKKAIKFMAGFLSAVILFTSESTSFLACASSTETPLFISAGNSETEQKETAKGDNQEEPYDDGADGSEMNSETDPSTPPSSQNPPADDETPPAKEEPGNGDVEGIDQDVPTDSDPETPNNPDEENKEEPAVPPVQEDIPSDDQNIGGDDTKEPEKPEETEDSAEKEKPPVDTVSDNSVSTNDLMTLEEDAPAMEDFAIVDEGGNLLDETRILYIEETSYRQLHVKLTPENAVAGEVIWSSDNARISVTDGKVTMKPAEASDGGLVTGIVSAKIGEITRTCKVEFQPVMQGIVIVDQNGSAVSESGISILPGQQKKLRVKIQPEGAVVENQQTTFSLDNTQYLTLNRTTGTLSVRRTPEEFPQEATVTAEVRNIKTGQKVNATCKVIIPAPSESDGIRCGDILFYCDGMQPDYKKSDTEPNTWEISANRSNCTLTYVGTEDPNMEYAIFYSTSSGGINTSNLSRPGTPYRKSFTYSNDKYPLQFVLGTKPKDDPRNRNYTLSDVYTIRGTLTRYRSDLRISPTTIRTIPGAPDQEIKVSRLPDTCEMKDVTWVSGDERLVRIKEKTEKGVMLQFGQSVGTTQIIAIAKDYRGQECYATCDVRMSMTLPSPSFDSESGGETSEETADGDTNDYWLIDKGGKVSITVRGVTKASIYYTTNGSDPVTNGILYQSPITVNAKTTIKAYAKLDGYADSPVNESEFRIGNPNMSISPTSATIQQGAEKAVSFTLPSGSDPSTITWSSSDSEIADGRTDPETDDEGNTTSVTHKIFSGSNAGKCTVTASVTDYAGREQTASCQVTVPGKLEITPAVTVEEEGTAVIKITKLPGGYTKDDVSWMVDSISDAALLTFGTDESGNKTIMAGRLENTQEARILTIRASVSTDEDDICARCQVTIVPRQYTVNFFGFRKKLTKTEKVYRNQSATPPSDEVMSAAAPNGYTFNGWEEPDSWKNIVADKDIYAKEYVQTVYTIDYILGTGGTNSPENPISYKVTDKTISLQDAIPAPEKKFAGWYLDQAYSDSPIAEIPTGSTGSITLYAKWISARTGLRIEPIADQPYTGKAILPEVKVYDGETLLTPGIDYTVKYKNNTKANTQPEADIGKAPTVTVTGKGNYEKSDIETFRIVPQSIASEKTEIVIPDLYLAYTGKKLTVTPTVTWNGKKLANKKDFEVTRIAKNSTEVKECIDEGEYTVTVSGKGNFAGTRDISLTVTKKTLLSKVSFKPNKLQDISWADLQGKTLGEADIQVDKGVTLKKGSDELKKGPDADYVVTFNTSAKEVGTYEAVFTGTGTNYVGTVTKTFKITGKPISASKLDIQGLNDLTYNGTAQMPVLTISYKDGNNKVPMTLDTDYKLFFDQTTNAGNKASVTITGLNGYSGTVKKTFKINPYSLKDASAATQITTSLASNSVPYEKGGAKPKVTVKYGETILTEGKDYTVSYKNNTKLASKDDTKAPSYTVKGKGNFKDSLSEATFSIVPQNIARLSITAEDVMAAAPKPNETVGKTGAGKYKSTPKITDINGKVLSAGTDFLKTYTFTDENGVVLGPKDQVPEDSVLTVTVEGTRNYTGIAKVSYRVLAAKMSLKGASISLKAGVTKTYDLEPVVLRKEDLVVKLNGQELSGDNYTIVSYVDNRKKGTAKVTIQGVGAYGGQKTVSFKISPRIIAWFKTP